MGAISASGTSRRESESFLRGLEFCINIDIPTQRSTPMKRIALLLVPLMLAACASTPTITTDSAPGTDFSKYRSFTWGGKPETENPLNAQRIMADVNAQLLAKGWTESAQGDVTLVAHVATQQKQTMDTFYTGTPYGGWGWRGMGMGMGSAQTVVNTYNVGTLVLDMFDTSTHDAIWRGTATATVPGSTKAQNEKIDAGIVQMFVDFPPGSAPAK